MRSPFLPSSPSWATLPSPSGLLTGRMGNPPQYPLIPLALVLITHALARGVLSAPAWVSVSLVSVACLIVGMNRLCYILYDGAPKSYRFFYCVWHPFVLLALLALINQVLQPGYQLPVSPELGLALLLLILPAAGVGVLVDRRFLPPSEDPASPSPPESVQTVW